MKNLVKVALVCALAGVMISTTLPAEAGMPLLGKIGESIGMGPSSARVGRRLEKGKPRILANGHKYQIINPGWGYLRAKSYAEQQLGHLAIIDNAYENRLLYEFMIAQGYESAYFGLADTRFEGNWTYPDGKSAKYTNWHRGQPKKDDNNARHAMLYSIFTNGQWKAGAFNKLVEEKGETAFIIEWETEYTPQQANDFNNGKPITIYPNGNPNVQQQPAVQQPTYSGGGGWSGGSSASSTEDEEVASFGG